MPLAACCVVWSVALLGAHAFDGGTKLAGHAGGCPGSHFVPVRFALEAERIDQPDLCSQVESVPVIDQFGGNEEDDGQAHLGVPAGDRAVG